MSKTDAKLVLLDEDHSGRDEMNLAGNPFALLQAASKNGQKQIKREWERRLANGKVVKASWEVIGHTELGLPGPFEELLYLILLQLTREIREETGEWHQTVYFSRHNLFSRLGWGGNSRDYASLQSAFFRMRAVSIQAIYSFHDPRTGQPLPTRGFGLIEDFAFAEEKTGPKTKNAELPLSWFKWSDVLYNSFCAGNVRSLALDFTLSLDGAVSRRLFRLLELLRHSKRPAHDKVKLDLIDLRSRLGMAEYKYSSKIKEKLQPATDELTTRGYLEDITYTKEQGIEYVTFKFASPTSQKPTKTPKPQPDQPATPTTPTLPLDLNTTDTTTPQPTPQEFAQTAHAIFVTLPESEQAELLDQAKREVSPIWHDRVGQPNSPMSLGLWKLVTERHQQTN